MAPTSRTASERLGQRLREAREAIDVSVDQLARVAKMPLSHLLELENGEEVVTAEALRTHAPHLGRTEQELRSGKLRGLPSEQINELHNRVAQRQGGRTAGWSTSEERELIAMNFRARRQALGWSQPQLALALGVSAQTTISHYENPKGKIAPAPAMFEKAAQVFGCDVEDLRSPPPPVEDLPTQPALAVRAVLLVNLDEIPGLNREDIDHAVTTAERDLSRRVLDEISRAERRVTGSHLRSVGGGTPRRAQGGRDDTGARQGRLGLADLKAARKPDEAFPSLPEDASEEQLAAFESQVHGIVAERRAAIAAAKKKHPAPPPTGGKRPRR